MGKIVMPKNSALLNEIEAVLKIYYEAGDWLSNDVYKEELKRLIGDDQYQSSYTKKAQITSYFGFTIWEDITNPQSKRKITSSGKLMYEALLSHDENAIQAVLMSSLENTTFGRNNYGCPDSDSDVEPPALFIRASLDLGYLTYKEFAYLLWKLEDLGKNYTDAVKELRNFRTNGGLTLGDEANKYTDCKPIMILLRWGFFVEDETESMGGKHISVHPNILSKYLDRLQSLKIYNIDKKNSASDSENDIMIDYAWYVGCTGKDENGIWRDFSDEYILNGIWINGYKDKLLDVVKSVHVGDKIAIKAMYNKKNNLPFNANGKKVGCMKIKAIGTVIENLNDGRNLRVKWEKLEPSKIWYGPGTLWKTIHYIESNDGPIKKALLDFTFGNSKQDYSICEEYYKNEEKETIDSDIVSEEDYTIDELAEILKGMGSSYETVLSIHLFGIRYGKYIRLKNYSVKDIISKAGLNDSYLAELNKGIKLSTYVEEVNDLPDDITFEDEDSTDYDSIERIESGDNIIYYGTPGCGKSYYVDDKYTEEGYVIYRTVFHPEYSNTDFVGQLIPKVDPSDKTKITYEYKEGIFTEAFKFAYYNPQVKVALIIEEINRGNASAIFGEIFQLLDREDNGKSHYYIHNENIASRLSKPSNYNIFLPSNFSLIGTMNTSDQNVYTLDTAFKRRWTMIKIKNTFAEMDLDVLNENNKLDYLRELSKLYIPGSSYTWREFVEKVNNKISTKAPTFSSHTDDKEIGLYFVSKKYLESSPNVHNIEIKRLFAEKVLMYIWNDIARTSPNKWFDEKTLDNVLEKFENSTTESLLVFNNELFVERVVSDSIQSEE